MQSIDIDILEYNGLNESFDLFFLSQSFSITLYFNVSKSISKSKVVGRSHLSKISKLFTDLRNNTNDNIDFRREINLTFDKAATNIDIAIIGAIGLFKKEFPNLLFNVKFPIFNEFESYAKFRDNICFINYWYKKFSQIELLNIVGKDVVNIPHDQLFIFPIDCETFNNYFVSTNHTWHIREIFENIESNEIIEFFNEYRKSKKFKLKKDESHGDFNFRQIKALLKAFDKKLNFTNNNRLFFEEYIKMLNYYHLVHTQFQEVIGNSKNEIYFHNFRLKNMKELELTYLRSKFS